MSKVDAQGKNESLINKIFSKIKNKNTDDQSPKIDSFIPENQQSRPSNNFFVTENPSIPKPPKFSDFLSNNGQPREKRKYTRKDGSLTKAQKLREDKYSINLAND